MAAALALTGCGTPPWAEAPAASAPQSEAPAKVEPPSLFGPPPAAVVTPPPAVRTPPPVVDDLADGSVKREFKAGAMTVAVDYWSTRNRADWTPQAVKPLTLSVSAVGAGDLALGALAVQVERLTADGWVAVPDGTVTQPDVAAAPTIKAPASAGATVMVGAVEPGATALRYTFSYTVTAASRSAKVQAVGNDSLTIALVPG
ncbi:hypothetical protein G7070_05435 [Propioniciclava coleopterorum]|uniref:Uncharacterized protein n=1 Tax=Propioniciclava coleopterorum TaxID=2714937 RepID=A0A6G7Y5B8_9ACTN|nr:hypothetical protein [Propioniciclava coleopterorum]QIK71821.1 hypothetical protein G7070_05435 [Propioniciclava coleopterorum]